MTKEKKKVGFDEDCAIIRKANKSIMMKVPAVGNLFAISLRVHPPTEPVHMHPSIAHPPQAESEKIPSGDYPHEPHACDLIPCLNGVTVLQ